MKINFRQSKMFAIQSARSVLKNELSEVTVPMMLHSMKVNMKLKAKVINMMEKSMGRSDHFTSLKTL